MKSSRSTRMKPSTCFAAGSIRNLRRSLHKYYMAATERFLEMARKKAQGRSGSTYKPSDDAISKKRLSLRVAFWRASASLRRLQVEPLSAIAPRLAACLAKTATQSHNIYVKSV